MPRLILKPYGYSSGKECELEQAKLLNYKQMVLVDGRRVNSYDELMQLVNQDSYQTKEFIEVILIPAISGG
jgi:hypothetical protein